MDGWIDKWIDRYMYILVRPCKDRTGRDTELK